MTYMREECECGHSYYAHENGGSFFRRVGKCEHGDKVIRGPGRFVLIRCRCNKFNEIKLEEQA